MREQDMEGKGLEYRARLFKPWLEEEATKEYFDIVSKKITALTRQVKNSSLGQPKYTKVILAPGEQLIPGIGQLTRNECSVMIQGQIEACEELAYLPHGVLKKYEIEQAKIQRQKQEQEAKRNG